MLSRYAASHNLVLDEAMQRFAAEAGISRYGQPEEIADLIAFSRLSGRSFSSRIRFFIESMIAFDLALGHRMIRPTADYD